jgi:hypothetical protein
LPAVRSDKDDAAGHGRRAERISAPGAVRRTKICDPAKAVLFVAGAGIERMQLAITPAFAWWLFVWIFTLARGVVRIRFAPSSDEAAMLEMRLRIRSTAGVTSSNFTGPLSAPVTCCAVVSFQPMRRAV